MNIEKWDKLYQTEQLNGMTTLFNNSDNNNNIFIKIFSDNNNSISKTEERNEIKSKIEWAIINVNESISTNNIMVL